MISSDEDILEEILKKNRQLSKYKLSRRARPAAAEPESAAVPSEAEPAVVPEGNGGAATEAAIRNAIRNYWGLDDEDEEQKLRRRK